MKQIYEIPGLMWQVDDNRWAMRKSVIVPTPLGDVLLWRGFRCDRDSYVPNSPDWVPSFCHDLLCRHGVFADQSYCSRWRADRIYLYLNWHSHCPYNHKRAVIRYIGVSIGSVVLQWHDLEPLPLEALYVYEYYRKHGILPKEGATI